MQAEFNCPHCNQCLEVPSDMLGKAIECPACKGSIQLPEPELNQPTVSRTTSNKSPSVSNRNAKKDAVPDEEKPPTKAQINKILKLGGDPEKATYRDEAEGYIWDLEQIREDEKDRKEDQEYQIESRAQSAIEDFFSFYDASEREMMAMKKPSMAVMKKAILYGDEQGWGEDWESHARSTNTKYDEASMIEVAIYAVSPQSLKEGYRPPELILNNPKPNQTNSANKGCLSSIVFVCGSSAIFFSMFVLLLIVLCKPV